MMLSAIAGSMIRAGGLTMLRAASERVRLWATVNDRHDQDELTGGAAEQEQADEEEQMVRPDDDVPDAGGQQPLHDGERALTRAREVLEPAASRVEDRLGQCCRLRRC